VEPFCGALFVVVVFERSSYFSYVAPGPSQFSLLLTCLNESIRGVYACANAAFCYFLVTPAAPRVTHSWFTAESIFIAGIIFNPDAPRAEERMRISSFVATRQTRRDLLGTKGRKGGGASRISPMRKPLLAR